MQHRADLADPLVDIRDVVESFRAYHLTVPGWDETLRRAIATLGRISPPDQVDAALPGLLSNLRTLLDNGPGNVPRVVDQVADQVAAVLADTRIPGIPAPADSEWAFSRPNAS